jgi:hypothetical protein
MSDEEPMADKVPKAKKGRSHPKNYDMMLEAMKELQEGRKGVTVQAMKNHIREHHPVDESRLKYGLRKALEKGLDAGSIARVGTTETGESIIATFNLSSNVMDGSDYARL